MNDDVPRRKKRKRSQAPGAALHNDREHERVQRLRAEAVRLRGHGLSYPAIGKTLGVDQTTAYRYVKDAYAAIPAENVEETRTRLRMEISVAKVSLHATIQHPKTKEGDRIRALVALRAYIAEEAKMEGCYAPQQHNVSFLDRMQPGKIQNIDEEALRRIANGDFSPLNGTA